MPEIVTQDELILKSVKRYYEYQCFLDITNLTPTYITSCKPEQKKRISISLIEYFILKYSKKHSTMYRKSGGTFFFVYANYKNFLKGYKKRFTDPFKRKDPSRKKDGYNEEEFYFTVHDITVRTRLAQLHFFRWVFEHELLTYIERNYQTIIDIKHSDDEQKKKKRTPCVVSITTSIVNT